MDHMCFSIRNNSNGYISLRTITRTMMYCNTWDMTWERVVTWTKGSRKKLFLNLRRLRKKVPIATKLKALAALTINVFFSASLSDTNPKLYLISRLIMGFLDTQSALSSQYRFNVSKPLFLYLYFYIQEEVKNFVVLREAGKGYFFSGPATKACLVSYNGTPCGA